jgi:hypothetical protein
MKTNLRGFASILAVLFSGGVTAAIAQTVASSPGGSSFPVDAATAGWLASAVTAFVVAGLRLRKVMSRDGVDRKADSYLQQALDQAKANEAAARERESKAMEEARKAWASKNADSLELGSLRTENRLLKEQLDAMSQQVITIRRGVQSVGQNVDTLKNSVEQTQTRINTGAAPLGER